MQPISNPKLPPKFGYVEIELDNGQRTYQKIEDPVSLNIMAAIAELAEAQAADKLAAQLAIAELAEAMAEGSV